MEVHGVFKDALCASLVFCVSLIVATSVAYLFTGYVKEKLQEWETNTATVQEYSYVAGPTMRVYE